MTDTPSLQSTRVLVIDDISAARKVVTRMLSASGFTSVSEAASVEQGLKEASSANYDLVIVDVHLKDGSAVDVIQKFRSALGAKCPKFLVMTSDLDINTFSTISGEGVTSYLLKPFNVSIFRDSIESCLSENG